jgi:hypothetical protein
MKTIELTVTRIREDIGHDSFIVKGKLGSAYVERQDNGQWLIQQHTGGNSFESRFNRDDAIAWAMKLCSTVFIK